MSSGAWCVCFCYWLDVASSALYTRNSLESRSIVLDVNIR